MHRTVTYHTWQDPHACNSCPTNSIYIFANVNYVYTRCPSFNYPILCFGTFADEISGYCNLWPTFICCCCLCAYKDQSNNKILKLGLKVDLSNVFIMCVKFERVQDFHSVAESMARAMSPHMLSFCCRKVSNFCSVNRNFFKS